MLMVIFGAGASYDASADYAPPKAHADRLPLANDLFRDGGIFRTARDRYPQIYGILSRLVPQSDRSIEEVLQNLYAESNNSPIRRQQLAAVRYYLRFLFHELTPKWSAAIGGGTNFVGLLDQIRHSTQEATCLVTFNYDTLLEEALHIYCGMDFKVMDDYIAAPDFKLFKVHGSQDWGRHVQGGHMAALGNKDSTPWANEAKMIEHVDTLGISQTYSVIHRNYGARWSGPPLYPALAIPMTDKEDFECPPGHLQALSQLMPKIDKIITIGWRGRERHFLKLLRGVSIKGVLIASVAKDEPEAEDTVLQIRQASVPVRHHQAFGGFTNAVGNNLLVPLLTAQIV